MHDERNPVAYIGNIRFPTEKAHGLQIAQVASALGALRNVTLYIPAQKNATDPYAYYDVPNTFSIVSIDAPRLSHLGPLGHLLETISFLSMAQRAVPKNASVYSRELLAPLFFKSVTLELHYLPRRLKQLASIPLRQARTILVKTAALRDDVLRLTDSAHVLVLPNAVDAKRFSIPDTQEEARRILGITHSDPLVLYCGSLQSWKGVGTFVAAAQHVPNVRFLSVGGTDSEHDVLRRAYPEAPVEYLPHQPYELMPLYLRAADILVLPNTAREEISTRYTSPLKLLEYLASGTPVVASAIPTVLAVAGEEALWLSEPDNPESLAQVIQKVMANPTEAAKRVQTGQTLVRGRTWQAYAQTISDLIP